MALVSGSKKVSDFLESMGLDPTDVYRVIIDINRNDAVKAYVFGFLPNSAEFEKLLDMEAVNVIKLLKSIEVKNE